MMQLSTLVSNELDKGEYKVMWRVGANRFGTLVVSDVPKSDGKALAELFSIQYLLFNMNVFDREILCGSGILLNISVPIIRKAFLKKTSNSNVYSHSAFFFGRLNGITIKVLDKKSNQLFNEDESCNTCVPVKYNIGALTDWIVVPKIGQIRLTEHSIAQYLLRQDSGVPNKVGLSIINQLRNPGIEKVDLPPKVLLHKIRKYGNAPEIWSHPSAKAKLYFVFDIDSSGIKTLVTIYFQE